MDGEKRNTRFNNHYVANVLGGKEFVVGKRKQNIIGLSARGTVAGGRRYTPIDEEMSVIKGYQVEDESRVYEAQAPVYHRVDFALYFMQNTKRATMTYKVDIQNIANHENVQDIDYDPERGIVEERSGQILPVMSFKVEF